MKYILNSREMKQCDSRTIEHYGLPSMVLMEPRYRLFHFCMKEICGKRRSSYYVEVATMVGMDSPLQGFYT